MFGIDPAALPMAMLAGVLLVVIIGFYACEYFCSRKRKHKGH